MAVRAIEASLGAIREARALNCFTAVFEDQARADAALAAADESLPLSGMAFAAKDLFDIAGLPTMAGAKINADAPPATQDATAVAGLKAAGATLVGLTNMDEYAYGFSTENAHFGPTHNPHDPDRIAGGSSGGSAAAVAAGLVPIALGSDTNGSIRVPASLCGIYGLKPTFGRLSRAGTFPFVASLDHVGPFARDLATLALAYDTLQGPDPRDPACTTRPSEPALPGLDDPSPPLRVGILDGWFREGGTEAALAAVDRVAAAFPQASIATLTGAGAARSAAFCLSGMEGGSLHRDRLQTRAMDFDPAVRDRLLAGLLLPASLSFEVRRVRRRFRDEAAALFRDFDLLIAPATPCSAPRIGEEMVVIAGREVPVRANLGLYTQPISFIGLPVIAAPVVQTGLPIGVQLIAAPWQEARLFRAAAWLERQGVVGSTPLVAKRTACANAAS